MKLNCLGQIGTECFLLLAALFFQTAGAATTEANLEKSFTVSPEGKLFVDADRGSIHITTGDRTDVAIIVKRSVSAASQKRAQEFLAAHEVTFAQDRNRIEVRAKSKNKFGLFYGGLNYRVEYQIAVPKRFNLELRTSAGGIASQDIEGTVKAKSSGGDFKFSVIKGSLEATTSAGSISLISASGPVFVKTSGGNLQLGQIDGDTTAITSAGSISITSAKGKFAAKTSGGNLDLGELAASAEVETSAGSIHIKSARAALSAKTSGGNIKIEDARDTVLAHTSAGEVSVAFSSAPRGDCSLTSSGGSIDVKLADNVGVDLEARTSGGRVNTEIPVATTTVGEHKTSMLKGTINGGGKALLLNTSAGSINIRKL